MGSVLRNILGTILNFKRDLCVHGYESFNSSNNILTEAHMEVQSVYNPMMSLPIAHLTAPYVESPRY